MSGSSEAARPHFGVGLGVVPPHLRARKPQAACHHSGIDINVKVDVEYPHRLYGREKIDAHTLPCTRPALGVTHAPCVD